MTVMRCPHCGGEVQFDPSGQEIRCEYCGSVITIDDYREHLDKHGLFQANELVCSQCGARIISTDSTVATFCSYCGSSLVLESHMVEEQKPDLIIPFKIKKAAALKKYREKIEKSLLAPDWMLDEESIARFRGIYMPFHLFRFSGTATYSGEATNTRVETYGGTKYDVTRTYNIEAPAEIDYDMIPVDASAAFPDPMSRAISPYHAKNMVNFELPYLAGYYADGKDVPAELYDSKYEAIARDDMESTGTVKTGKLEVDANEVLSKVDVKRSVKTALFPAWFLSIRNGDRISYAAVNGETGELAADIPIDFKKYLAASVILAGAVSLILNLFFTITPIRFMTIASALSAIVFLVADRLMDDTYRQSTRTDDPGYTGEDADKVVHVGAVRKVFAVTGTVLTGLIAMLMSIILAAMFRLESVFFLGLVPAGILIYTIAKSASDAMTNMQIKRKRAPLTYKALTLAKPITAVILCACAALVDRNSDLLCYCAGLASILLTVWTAFDVVKAQNRLTMRDLPLFTGRRGGDE